MMIYANKERIPGIIAERKHRLEELARPEIWTRYTKNMECGEYKEFKQSCIDDEIIIEALEKQVPKKLICIEVEKCCPICKEGICLIGDDGNYGNHCLNCGQALDWSNIK